MLDWREREHVEEDEAAINHQPSLDALRACGLYKYWTIPGMRGQVRFLEWLVERWNVQEQCFYIGGHQLEIEPSDVYFLTGLPNRGEQLNLAGTRPGGQSLDDLREEWCRPGTRHKKGVEIKHIALAELRVIAFTVTRICGAAALHIASGSQMRMAVDCYQGTIFNWCEAVSAHMKSQLTKAKNGRLKTFGYGPIVVSFALERVPMLIPQQLTVDDLGPREPKLVRWVAVMARHPDEGAAVVRFSDSYFDWLEGQLFVIQDFPYAGMDFRGDPDMVLPQGEQWDDRGTFIFTSFLIMYFLFFIYISSQTNSKILKMQMLDHSVQPISGLTTDDIQLHRHRPHRTRLRTY